MDSLLSRDEPPDDRQFVTALARGLDILRCFTVGDRALSNGDIAKRTGLPKSTVSRLTYTLTQLGYLHPAQGNGYRIGPSVLSLGYVAASSLRSASRKSGGKTDSSAAFEAYSSRAPDTLV